MYIWNTIWKEYGYCLYHDLCMQTQMEIYFLRIGHAESNRIYGQWDQSKYMHCVNQSTQEIDRLLTVVQVCVYYMDEAMDNINTQKFLIQNNWEMNGINTQMVICFAGQVLEVDLQIDNSFKGK